MHSIRFGRRSSQSGFTLMELLVVLVILGFLLGMVLPRLGSVADNAVDTICDSNNKGVRYFTKVYLDQKGRLPNNLTNLVSVNDAGTTIEEMTVSDLTEEGAGQLHPDFVERNGYTLYELTEADATALKAMGISKVRNFLGVGNQSMAPVDVAADLQVAMVGDLSTAPTDRAAVVTAINADGGPWGNPYWYGRMMFGVGDSSSLLTEGYLQAAALCPGGIQNQDVVSFNNYVLIVPRLESMFASGGALAAVKDEVITLTAGEMNAAGTAITAFASGDEGYRVETFTLESQDKWNFDFACPEGHKWPDNDSDYWSAS